MDLFVYVVVLNLAIEYTHRSSAKLALSLLTEALRRSPWSW
jgi:hypothetical protein